MITAVDTNVLLDVFGADPDRADRLLTRDRGFYRKHFDRLAVIDPT